MFYGVDDQKDFHYEKFKEFTSRQDIKIIQTDTVCGRSTVYIIVYYEELK
jgi:hypothetical protein